MFTFSCARPAVWLMVALLAVTTASATCDVATAADLATPPDARRPGSAGTLEVTPDRHNFGKVIVTTTSAPETITVTNISNSASIEFTTIVAALPFMIQSDGCSGSPLAAGAVCHVDVVFSPTNPGRVDDLKGLTFRDSARNSPQHVELLGNGIVSATPTATNTATATRPVPTPTATVTTSPKPTPSPSSTATSTVTGTPTCTPHPSATPSIAHLVLIAGGQASDGTPISSAEVFNPATNIFTLTTNPMNDARYGHAAAAINTSGAADVLVTGGFDTTGVAQSTEVFTGSAFSAGPGMTDSREGHTATAFNDDTTHVLIAGGRDADGTVLDTAEVSGAGTSLMNSPRENAATVLLAEPFANTCPANAVITGGSDGVNPLQTAELFNPANNTFTLTDDPSLSGSPMNAARAFHTATLLPNSGKFLVAGGEGGAGVAQASAEIFDVGTKKFTLTTALGGTDMTVARQKHTATAIGETVLIAGGIDNSGNALSSAEVFDLSTNSFTAVGSMHTARFNHAAAKLPSGKVLITGGEDGSGNTLNTAEIFDPATNKFTLTTDASLGGNNMNVARKLHTATAY
jgi:hypothetical protein